MDFRSKSILIVGEGVSGMSALYTLQKQGANCIIYDGRQAFPEDIDYDYAVVSPGVPTDNAVFEFAAKRKIKLIGELELGWLLNNDKPLIAVTGTNGKTTVTQLIGDILSREHKVAVCGGGRLRRSRCGNVEFSIGNYRRFSSPYSLHHKYRLRPFGQAQDYGKLCETEIAHSRKPDFG